MAIVVTVEVLHGCVRGGGLRRGCHIGHNDVNDNDDDDDDNDSAGQALVRMMMMMTTTITWNYNTIWHVFHFFIFFLHDAPMQCCFFTQKAKE